MTAVDKVRAILDARALDVAVLASRANFAWLTRGGSSAVAEQTDTGVGVLAVTRHRVYLLSDNIEIGRLRAEQLGSLGVIAVSHPWHWPNGRADALARLIDGGLAGSDAPAPGMADISADLVAARSVLSSEELDDYRSFAATASTCIETVLRRVQPGWTEQRIAGAAAKELLGHGLRPAVLQVGVDERLFRYRHVMPTSRPLQRYALISVCAEKHGLIANTSRFVHFGPLPADLARRHEAAAHILTEVNAATVPGQPYAQIWRALTQAYADTGYRDEWMMHHQGGPTGYAPREWILTADTPGVVQQGMAFAWNPSIAGAKAEDTILVTATGPETITLSDSWPQRSVVVRGVTSARADVLTADHPVVGNRAPAGGIAPRRGP